VIKDAPLFVNAHRLPKKNYSSKVYFSKTLRIFQIIPQIQVIICGISAIQSLEYSNFNAVESILVLP